ncbi:MAG: D-alanine--D-alanine ligase [Ruminococcaceae bacterium]|nr:D-alanine--D-alanine ligase [Oscillospiraceae bacterium]
MNITVLAGGLSPERDVSLTSGSLIANALRRKGHRVALVDVYLGTDVTDADALFISEEMPAYRVSESEPDLNQLKAESGNGDALIGKNVIEACRLADVVFLALHGAMGENGQLQATLDCFGIPYTGTGYVGSLLAMDKDISKKLMVEGGVPTATSITLMKGKASSADVMSVIGLPCVIKPCSCGSSVGVSIVHDEKELEDALAAAFAYEDRVLVEKKIVGREMTVGILRGKTLPPVEIIPKCGFYDYKNKYQSGMTEEICPPAITEEEGRLLSDAALKVAELLRLGSYCRIDFILSDGVPYCLEANTLPGMTPLSLLPREAAAVGISYDELCEIIATDALKQG